MSSSKLQTYTLVAVGAASLAQYYAQFPPFPVQTQAGRAAFALLSGVLVGNLALVEYAEYKAKAKLSAELDTALFAALPFAAGWAAAVYGVPAQGDIVKLAVLLGVNWAAAKVTKSVSLIDFLKVDYAIIKGAL